MTARGIGRMTRRAGWLGIAALAAGVMVGAAVGAAQPAHAATTCTFTTTGKTMKLNGNCTTDAPVVVPNGVTLDGAGFTITGIDPPGGHFKGGVVQNGGASANVTNLRVTVAGLANVCDALGDRL